MQNCNCLRAEMQRTWPEHACRAHFARMLWFAQLPASASGNLVWHAYGFSQPIARFCRSARPRWARLNTIGPLLIVIITSPPFGSRNRQYPDVRGSCKSPTAYLYRLTLHSQPDCTFAVLKSRKIQGLLRHNLPWQRTGCQEPKALSVNTSYNIICSTFRQSNMTRGQGAYHRHTGMPCSSRIHTGKEPSYSVPRKDSFLTQGCNSE